MAARAAQIYKIEGTKRTLDLDRVSRIFRNIQDTPVALVSVNGIKRSGKSFFLNLLLKFLQSDGHNPNWLQEQFRGASSGAATDAFEWIGGAERKTVGIWVWSEPIMVRTRDGKEIAVVLMDTQGSFDGQTTFADNALIFATSVWLSSLFIYNLKDDLSEDKLQFLEYFADFSNGLKGSGASGAASPSKGPLFQHLFLLIRDWPWPKNYAYGPHSYDERVSGTGAGRGNYTADFLCGKPNQSEEGLATRRDIAAKFSTTSSFLLPHPGLPLAQNDTSILNALEEVEPLFLKHLQALLSLVRTEIEEPKVIYGQVQTGRSVQAIMAKWAQLVESNEIPQAKSLTQATAEANLEMSLHRTEKMLAAKLLDLTKRGLPDAEFDKERDKICRQIRDNFVELSKGFQRYQSAFVSRLEETIKNGLAIYVQFNTAKRLQKEQEARIREMADKTEAMNEQIAQQNDKMTDLQRNLETQTNLSAKEKEELQRQVEQVKQDTAALIQRQERELQEQKKRAVELEHQVEETERRMAEERERVSMPQQAGGGLLGILEDILTLTPIGPVIKVIGGLIGRK